MTAFPLIRGSDAAVFLTGAFGFSRWLLARTQTVWLARQRLSHDQASANQRAKQKTAGNAFHHD